MFQVVAQPMLLYSRRAGTDMGTPSCAVGVLETLPSTLSNRPKGWAPRSDLEELLSSPLATDWRKIASFFLGPEPEGFSFTVSFDFCQEIWHQDIHHLLFILKPKHKSNSEAQTQG